MKYSQLATVQKKQNLAFGKFIKELLFQQPFIEINKNNLLDIGGANGEFANLMKNFQFKRIVNIDIDKDMIEQGKKLFPQIEHICEDFFKWQSEETFNFIVSTNVFHHFIDWDLAIRKTYNLLTSPGAFFLHQHCKGSFCSLIDLAKDILLHHFNTVTPYKKSFLTIKEIKEKLEETGFQIVKIKTFIELTGEFSLEESYKSWLVGAGKDFVLASGNPEKFSEIFMQEALKKELPIESIRIMVACFKK
ncbi:MAG: class I SAM-dependent methyltransferase [Candidatus Aenigmatarchaeota archaeon]